jgi:glucose/arabinose dehydrogenase
MLVAEQAGRVRYADDGQTFMDLSDIVNDDDWEQGLFDLALHPAYPADDRLFVSFSDERDAVVIASVHLRGDRGSLASILEVAQPTPVHNGGRMAFGTDGLLYVGLGEGGPGDVPDPDRQGQNPATLLGTIVRLDVNGRTDGYRVPADNPFVGGGGAPEVWAYGLRNPWGLSFDQETGDLWVADVGHAAHEEVNRLPAGTPAGRNLGWSRFEGTTCFRPDEGCDTSDLTMPVVDLAHADGHCSVIGGQVYRGASLNWLVGRYVFSDYCTGRLYSVSVEGNHVDLRREADLAEQPTAIEVGEDGELYVVTYDGDVLRIKDAR